MNWPETARMMSSTIEWIVVSGVVLRLVVKTAPLAQWAVSRELRSRIKTAFDEAEGER